MCRTLSVALVMISLFAANAFAEHAPRIRRPQIPPARPRADAASLAPSDDCAREMKNRGAGKLPPLLVTGEIHDHPYCADRREFLIAEAKKPGAKIAVGFEGFNQGEIGTAAPGLEDPHLKAIVSFGVAYRGLAGGRNEGTKAPDFGGFDMLVATMGKADAKDAYARLRKFPAETGLSAAELNPIDDVLSKIPVTSVTDKAALAALAKLDVAKIAKVVKAMMLRMAKETPPEKLRRYGLGERFAADVEEKTGRVVTKPEEYDKWLLETLSRPREKAMAAEALRQYCAMLLARGPQVGYHALVGNNHVPFMAEQLTAALKDHGVNVVMENGNALAAVFDGLHGKPSDKGEYADAAMKIESVAGVRFVSEQFGGMRFTYAEHDLDPTLSFHTPGPLSQGVRFSSTDAAFERFGDKAKIEKAKADFAERAAKLLNEAKDKP